ncbi:MAG: hypothetical protein ETSY1_09735 [Candidatus Entotheonella factor]|uniref:Nucleotide exchange factor GrpE n=1 Tax=Entotheonella factor TaxID=1429438 RepID=W4LS98_ENTF1|nr:MAG: hypothetical protein ETSY1_09735 [Candidatus Entotheonella factor]
MNDGLHRRWHDVRTMLTDWLAWLDETQSWAETAVAADASSERSEVPLGREMAADTAPVSEAPDASDHSASRADLSTLLAAMTALRQEVNLQTRSARRDREQASETLETLSAVVDQLSRETEDEDASSEVDTVHIDVLLDLHDALSRAERQASQVITSTVDMLRDWYTRQEIGTETDRESEDMPVEAHAPVAVAKSGALERLREWFGGPAKPTVELPRALHEPADEVTTADGLQIWVEIGAESGRMADRLKGLMTGYRLSLQRLERILLTCDIEPISCLDRSVDPELMEVVQIVSDTTKPPGTVTGEVRCGYRRHSHVYRFAQVLATRAEATPSHTSTEQTPGSQAS